MDRVLAIEGIELVGINNRDLGISLTSMKVLYSVNYSLAKIGHFCSSTGTFKVDISNTKKLLEGERGERIRQKGIIVSTLSRSYYPSIFSWFNEC